MQIGTWDRELPQELTDSLRTTGSSRPDEAAKFAVAQAEFSSHGSSLKVLSGFMEATQALALAQGIEKHMRERAERLSKLPTFANARLRHAKRYGVRRHAFVIFQQNAGAAFGRGPLYSAQGFQLDERGMVTTIALDAALDREPTMALRPSIALNG